MNFLAWLATRSLSFALSQLTLISRLKKFASLVVRPSEFSAPPLLTADPRTMTCDWVGKLMLKLILAIWMSSWAVAFTRPKILDMVVVLSP
jgi:hypothetical protein